MLIAMKNQLIFHGNWLRELPDLLSVMKNFINNKVHSFSLAVSALHQLSPLAVLQRGYSLTVTEDFDVIRSINKLNVDDNINIILQNGLINCTVKKLHEGEFLGKKSFTKK